MAEKKPSVFPWSPADPLSLFPCFKHLPLELWVGKEQSSLPRHGQHSRAGAKTHPLYSPAPSLLPSPASDNNEDFHQPGSAVLEGSQEGISSEITWCWNKLQASARGVQVTLKGEGCKRRNKLVSLLILCCG